MLFQSHGQYSEPLDRSDSGVRAFDRPHVQRLNSKLFLKASLRDFLCPANVRRPVPDDRSPLGPEMKTYTRAVII